MGKLIIYLFERFLGNAIQSPRHPFKAFGVKPSTWLGKVPKTSQQRSYWLRWALYNMPTLIGLGLFLMVLMPLYTAPMSLLMFTFPHVPAYLLLIVVIIATGALFFWELRGLQMAVAYFNAKFALTTESRNAYLDAKKRTPIKKTLISMALYSFMLTANIALGLLVSTQSANQDAIEQLQQNSPLFLIFVAGILAPVVEELTFRGLVMPIMNRVFNRDAFSYVGVVISGVLFGIVHAGTSANFTYFAVIAILGCCLGLIYKYTRSLKYNIIVHMCYNTVPMLVGYVYLVMGVA